MIKKSIVYSSFCVSIMSGTHSLFFFLRFNHDWCREVFAFSVPTNKLNEMCVAHLKYPKTWSWRSAQALDISKGGVCIAVSLCFLISLEITEKIDSNCGRQQLKPCILARDLTLEDVLFVTVLLCL